MLELSSDPKHYPQCCLSLSYRLFQSIKDTILHVQPAQDQRFNLVSVGCGTGFFEAALSTHLHNEGLRNVRVCGIETFSAEIPFLHEDAVYRVRGTWDMLEDLEDINALVFVYPREAQLVRRHLDIYQQDIAFALWLGPVADWVEHDQVLHRFTSLHDPEILENFTLQPYEIGAIFRKKSTDSSKLNELAANNVSSADLHRTSYIELHKQADVQLTDDHTRKEASPISEDALITI